MAELSTVSGEQAGPGNSVVTPADFAAWQIETTDLTEFSVVTVQPRDRVTLQFDAVPGLELPGEVLRINPVGKDQRGDINYTALIRPLQTDARLRWNMTAAITFD